MPSIVGFHRDTNLSSIRRIKLTAPAHVSPLPIIFSHPVCGVHSMTQFPLSFLYGFTASMAWTAHWVKYIPGIWGSFSEEDGIYLHLYIQKSYVMLFHLAFVQKPIFRDIKDALLSYTVPFKSIGKPIYFCLLYSENICFKIKAEFHHLLLLFCVNNRKKKIKFWTFVWKCLFFVLQKPKYWPCPSNTLVGDSVHKYSVW